MDWFYEEEFESREGIANVTVLFLKADKKEKPLSTDSEANTHRELNNKVMFQRWDRYLLQKESKFHL